MLIKQERYVQSCIAYLLVTKWVPLARLKYSQIEGLERWREGWKNKMLKSKLKGFIFGKSAKKKNSF